MSKKGKKKGEKRRAETRFAGFGVFQSCDG